MIVRCSATSVGMAQGVKVSWLAVSVHFHGNLLMQRDVDTHEYVAWVW